MLTPRTVLVALTLVALTLAAPAFAAPPACKERVKALEALADRLDAERKAGPIELTYPGRAPLPERLEDVADWRARGLKLLTRGSVADPGATLADLAVAKDTKLELCVEQNAPFEGVLSKDADPATVKRVVKEIATMDAQDRATIVASHFSEEKWKCKDLKSLGDALANVHPLDRLAIASRAVAESLTACKCPAQDAELAFALVSLLADTWKDKVKCAPVTMGKAGAKALQATGTWSEVLAQLESGATVPAPAAPPKKP